MIFKSLAVASAMASLCTSAYSQTDTTSVVNLDGIVVSARIANINTSSLRITDIGKDQLRLNAPGHTFPELIRNVPGVYSSAETGSFGDAKVNIRGFKQENISVLLNGIPISGLTSGSMYWNNWMGLSDATSSIQVQKGIGNSMVSDNSVGGTINIITNQPDPAPKLELGYNHTGYGTNSAFVSVNSGNLKSGWAYKLIASHNWGSSYADCTDLDTWAYSLAVNKRFNSRHSLNLTALGAPERHRQRSQRLSYAEVEKYGTSYSKNWGWQTAEDGKKFARTLSRNKYFKPYFTLTHSYQGNSFQLINSLYASFANGGGYYTESTGRRIASFLIPEGSEGEGQIDWDAAISHNKSVAPDANGLRAVNIMSDYLAGHTQLGLKSDLIKDFNERTQIDVGVHYQLYDTWEKEKITDLLGADYWYEDYSRQSIAGLAGRNPIKKKGDYVRTNNGRLQHYLTLYAMGTYKAGRGKGTVLTLGASISGTALRRWDSYNYTRNDKWSDWTGRIGGSVKAGVLFNLTEASKLYANAAVYSRAPYANVFFSNGNNTVSKDINNEKNYMGELGFRRIGSKYGAELTGYMAYWKDKSLLSSPYKSLDEDACKYMIKGLDALHYGLEADAWYTPLSILRLEAFASVGNWKWKNDVNATIYDPQTMKPAGEINVYSSGLHVGDAPQTQIGASISLNFPSAFSIMADWNYNDRFWADFDPVTRTSAEDKSDSYRIPGYHLLNLGLTLHGNLVGQEMILFLNLNNLTNTRYIERSKDGSGHDKNSFTGYWGNCRNVNFGIRLSLGR